MNRRDLRRLLLAQIAFVFVLLAGTLGFHLTLDEGWVAAFYRSVVSTTLTGLDSRPEGADAQIFTILLLLAGVAIFLYIAGAVVDVIARGAIADAVGQRRRRRAIEGLSGHTIICGFGRVGRRAAQEFARGGSRYVVLDINEEPVAAARELGALVVHGDGSTDDDLEAAGLSRARALVACADSDEHNLFITLSARAARPDVFIVARASDDAAARKLRLAGADRVVQPYSTAGAQIANLVMKPQVAAFLDVVATSGGPSFRLEEIEITPTCPQAGSTIRELRVRDRTGAMIVALRKRDGTFETTPSPDARLETGDVLIGVGTDGELEALEDLLAPQEPVAR